MAYVKGSFMQSLYMVVFTEFPVSERVSMKKRFFLYHKIVHCY